MKMHKTLSIVLAAGMAVSSTLALAQGGPPPQGGPGGPGRGDQGDRGDHKGPPPGHGGPQRGAPQGHGPQHGGPPPRGHAGPAEDTWQHPEWRKGDRVPQQYRDRQYVVENYRDYRLQPPRRGYQWVGVGGDFLLVAIATGVIADMVVGGGR
ncbi:hypothetical protein PIN31115_02547 [Pandoraea iniqua]|uniref:Uncharacterized protein n=1 Tax=Pandoraea iniqua TaxID=2508288 RepID=A0A5E4VBZ1_9BURK|nr:RcnB family protein [Pandoraea iniqua]VVE09631.1 hypothetical protein PIN31115_02547 [Pandoraea iniqua]